MKKLFRLPMLTAILCTAVWGLSAQSGSKISIQSTLKNSNGQSLEDGEYDVKFRFYTTSTGGTHVWEEVATVQLIGGVYSHALGSITPLVLSDFNDALYVGVTVNNIELLPRTELTYAPYTLYTKYATRTTEGVPPGTMMPFCGPLAKVPAGYIPCDGRAVSSADYPDLFAAIGTTWGNGTQNASGGGVKDFNVPDSRGYFLRGWGADAASADPDRNARTATATGGATGNNVGTLQGDALQSHGHTFSTTSSTVGNHTHSYLDQVDAGTPGGESPTEEEQDYKVYRGLFSRATNAYTHSHSVSFTTSNSGDSTGESRPDNVSVLFIIKI